MPTHFTKAPRNHYLTGPCPAVAADRESANDQLCIPGRVCRLGAGDGGVYRDLLGFEEVFVADWHVQLQAPGQPLTQLGIVARDHDSVPNEHQRPPAGVLIGVGVDDVDTVHDCIVDAGHPILRQVVEFDGSLSLPATGRIHASHHHSTFVTLDGVINYMEKWHFGYIDADSDALSYAQLAASDALLMGRKTYESYAAVWPTVTSEYADLINRMPKFVASSTLTSAQWENTTVISTNVVARAAEQRQQDGQAILMHGFGPIAKALLAAGLLDELHLWYHPVFGGVGDGDDTLFQPGLNVVLEHVGTRTLASGVVVLSSRTVPTS